MGGKRSLAHATKRHLAGSLSSKVCGMNKLASQPGTAADGPPGERTRLNRLIDAWRRRDWLGIGIELAVVTLGVLLAFQVDQWGDRRSQAKEERRFLERLYTEYHRGIAELDFVDSESRRVRDQLFEVLTARATPAHLEELSRRKDFGCGAPRFRSANFNDTGFEELVASGRLNLISDQALRSQVRDLAAAQATSSRQVENARGLMLNQLPYLDPYYRFDVDASRRESCHIDWVALVKDQKAVNAVVRAYRVHGFIMDERQKVRAGSQALIRRLACLLGKPECAR